MLYPHILWACKLGLFLLTKVLNFQEDFLKFTVLSLAVTCHTFLLNQLLFFNQLLTTCMVQMSLTASSVPRVLNFKRALKDENQQLINFISLVIT